MFAAMELANVGMGRATLVAALATIVTTAVALEREDGSAEANADREQPHCMSRPLTDVGRAALQAGVTTDGFVVAQAIDGGQRVHAVERSGQHRELADLFREGDVRITGTSAGPAGGFLEARKFHLASVVDDRDVGMWGTNARMLCDGIASNDHRFGIGWLENDGGVWMVHGPMSRSQNSAGIATELETTTVEMSRTAAPASWCGIASADDKIALFWRDRDRLKFQMCTRKKCGGIASSIKFPRNNLVLGMGCQRNGCLVAHREPTGAATISYYTESGSLKWKAGLDTDATSVSIVAAGDRAFAVGYSNREGAHVLRYERTKADAKRVWLGATDAGVPKLAWSKNYLLIAHYTNHVVTPISIELPR
jgi:hypothetical protein